MDVFQNLSDEELLKASVVVLRHEGFKFLRELLRRRQARQVKSVCSLSDPIDIYRSQGQVKAYDAVLNLESEIKALK